MGPIARTGAIIFLAGLFLLAGQIGNSFQQTVTIFSIIIWTIAFGMFLYLILFRGLKLDLFSKANVSSDLYEPEEKLDRVDDNNLSSAGNDRAVGTAQHGTED